MPDLAARLARAITAASRPSSDFDLATGLARPGVRNLRPAAVLIAITDEPRPGVILTKRSSRLKHHPGQIAFPGGKVDDSDDDAEAAALRETEEEVGLARSRFTVIGALPPHETVTGFSVTPFVALTAPGQSFKPEPGEVEEVFRAPLDHVTDLARYRIERRLWLAQPRPYYVVPWGPYYIWGATARMLRQLAGAMADAEA